MNKLVDIMTFSHSVQRFYLVSAIVVIVTLAILVPSPSSAYQPPIVPRLDIVTSDYELSYHEGVRAIDLKGNTTLHLKCQGHSPMSWSFPQIFWYDGFSIENTAEITNKCAKQGRKQICTSDFIWADVSYDLTGTYSCHYNDSMDILQDNSIYVFVNNPINLLAPYEGNELIFMSVVQSQPTTIPCIPTSSKATVQLIKVHARPPSPIEVDGTMVTYNPTKGFHFVHPVWDTDNTFLECIAFLNGVNETKSVSIHWTVPPETLYPFIEDYEASHVSINSTFSLTCNVHIDLGVVVAIDWDFPDTVNESRVIKSGATNERTKDGGRQYNTISRKITVVDTQLSDAGSYECRVNDANGRIHLASHNVVVYDKLFQSNITFETDLADFSRNVGDCVQFVVSVHAMPDPSKVFLYWTKNGKKITKRLHMSVIKPGYVQTTTESPVGNIVPATPHFEAHVDRNQMILKIDKLTMRDSGVYMLYGNTTDGLSSANVSLHLKVQGRPIVEITDNQDFYLLGENYTVNCEVAGYPKPTVWWRWFSCDDGPEKCNPTSMFEKWSNIGDREGEVLPNNVTMLNETHDKLTWITTKSLIMTATSSGLLQCWAQNINGTTSTQSRFIVTNAKNGFGVEISDADPVEKADITLTCRASGFNYSSLSWFYRPDELTHLLPVVNRSDVFLTTSQSKYSLETNITLRNIQLKSSGHYHCNASRLDGSTTDSKSYRLNVSKIQSPSILKTNMVKDLVTAAAGTMLSLNCYVDGKPKPRITWFKNDHPLKTDKFAIELMDEGQKVIIRRLVVTDSGKYECRVENSGGKLSEIQKLKVTSDRDGVPTGSIVLLAVFVAIGIVFVFMAIFLGKRIREERRQKRELEFFSANLFDQGQVDLFNPDMPLDEQVDLLPYDRRWEFPKERLKLGKTLGQGAFGRVVRAEAIGLDDDEASTTVAVKMLKERADLDQKKALMSELKIMIHLGRHLNIVNLLGAVTSGIATGELMVMVEYCRFGNLRHYLLAHREKYVDQINPETGLIDASIQTLEQIVERTYVNEGVLNNNTKTTMGVDNPSYQGGTSVKDAKSVRYVELQHDGQADSSDCAVIIIEKGNNEMDSRGTEVSPNDKNDEKDRLVNTCDLICYAFQVARGMEYLASRKLIHRDLAARNVLLAEENVVKICDFGLAKDCYKYDNYVKKGDGPLPVKWMAIESIRDKVSTIKSDVWSFAILCWEFFTLGGNPYPGFEIDEEFYKRLKGGYRMERPDYCPEVFYDIMNRCWDAEPKERPDFTELSETLGNLLEASVRQHYVDLNDPYHQMNAMLFENNDYLNMRPVSQMPEENDSIEQNDYLSMSRPNSDPSAHYDPVGAIRAVDGGPAPKVPMEVVPMIQLDSFSDHEDGPIYTNQKIVVSDEEDEAVADLSVASSIDANAYMKMNGLVNNINLNVTSINKLNKKMVEVTDSCHHF